MSAARESIGAIPFTLTANVESLPHLIHVAGPKEIAPALQSPFTGFHISLLKQRISDGPVRKILPHRVVFKRMFRTTSIASHPSQKARRMGHPSLASLFFPAKRLICATDLRTHGPATLY